MKGLGSLGFIDIILKKGFGVFFRVFIMVRRLGSSRLGLRNNVGC